LRETDALPELETVLHDYDDLGQGLAVAGWMIYRQLQRSKVPVSLDGHGADELMGGYKHPASRLGSFCSLLGDHLRFRMGLSGGRDNWMRRLRARVRRKSHPFLCNGRPPLEGFERVAQDDVLPAHWDGVDALLYTQFHSTILPTILRSFDRIPMAHGIEVRSPFLDWRLVRFVISLPSESKINSVNNKWIAREGMRGLMPESIRTNKYKIGLNSPLPEWLPGPLREWALNLLHPPGGDDHPVIKIAALRKAFEARLAAGEFTWSDAGLFWKYLHVLWFERYFLRA